MKSFKVKSNGVPVDTEIFDQNGNKLGCVQKCTIVLDVKEPVGIMTLEVIVPEVDIEIPKEGVKMVKVPLRELGSQDPVCYPSVPVEDDE